MKQNFLQQILLYRYRYIIGYGLFLTIMFVLLLSELTRVPAGLTAAEMQSAVHSSQLQVGMDTRVTDLPYHLLQKASIKIFGLSAFAIKLPSVIIAALSGIGLLLLLRRWFKHNVSIISALLAVSSSIFLISGRTGTPDVMVIFWAVYILLFATLITQEAKGSLAWKILLGLSVGLSLYTPLSIYLLGAVLVAGFLHPHARYMIKRYGGPAVVGALFFFALAVAPLAWNIWQSPQVALALAGWPDTTPDAGEYASHLGSIAVYFAGFTEPHIAQVIQPAFNIAMLVLIALGILRSIIDNHSTRTYTLLIWTAILIPVMALNPEYTVGFYVPAMLFMAIGTETLIREWYSLFPLNPYARLAGLFPLIALIGGVWYYNFTTYFIGYRYSPETAEVFNNDLSLLRQNTDRTDRDKFCLVVPEDKLAFYEILERKRLLTLGKENPAQFTVTSANDPECDGDIVAREAVDTAQKLESPTQFWVSDRSQDSLRWYVYF